MNFWSPFPFVRIIGAFIIGILLANYYSQPSIDVVFAASLVVFIYLAIALILKKNKIQSEVAGILALVTVASIGFLHTLESKKSPQEVPDEIRGYQALVISDIEVKERFSRMEVEIQNLILDDSLVESKLNAHLYVRRDSAIDNNLKYGDLLVIKSGPKRINGPTNPGEFDFASYWGNKNIFYQDFIDADKIDVLGNDPPNGIMAFSYRVKSFCEEILTEAISGEQEQAIALALILGVKEGLDNNLKSAYAAAGAMHVLAVSGLHVGILYLFILYAFRPIRDTKYGGLITGFVSLCILWFYALLTGFSPSVQRAVVMFSVFIIGRMFGKSRNIYNSLAFSALILLLINPLMVYEVGFQLSYLAVFGIVFLQPKIYQLWSPDYWLTNKAWEITCVSIAAQLATFPLGLYYFHQFPTLFLLSNLFVIPTAFLVLILGIFVLIFAGLGLTFYTAIGSVLSGVLSLLNYAVFAIEGIEFSVLNGIQLSLEQAVLIYLSLLFFTLLFLSRNFKYLIVTIVLIFITSGIELTEAYARSQQNEIVFYDIYGHTLIDIRRGYDTNLVGDSALNENSIKFIVSPNRLASGLNHENITPENFNSWQKPIAGVEVKIFHSKKFVRLSERDWQHYQFQRKLQTDYLIISNNSVKNIEDLMRLFSFDQLIIDSSNSIALAENLTNQTQELGIQIHSTRLNGALTSRF